MNDSCWVIKFKDTNKVFLRRGKPVKVTNPNPDHLKKVVKLLTLLTGREVYAVHTTLHRLQTQSTAR